MKRPKRDLLVAYSFILPNFIGFAVFTLVPLVWGLVLAFMKWDGAHAAEFIGLSNFVRLTGDAQFKKAFTNTMAYTIGVVPMTMVCSLGLALLLNTRIRGRNAFRTMFFFPYVASLVAVAAVWNFVFNPVYGPVNQVLHLITGIPVQNLPRWAADKDWALITVILFSVWKNMGYYMVLYLAGLQGINEELYEAAGLDGANAWQKFRFVTLPQLKSTTFFVSIMLVIYSFKVYDIFINLFAGADNQLTDSTRVLVYQIYNTAFRIGDYGYASSFAMVLFVMVLLITLIQFRGEKKYAGS